MIWMIDFNKKMEMKRFEREMEKYYSRVRERKRNKWRTSKEMMIRKCLMKVKCMGNGLKDWSWHEIELEMKKF